MATYQHSQTDTWAWTLAGHQDVEDILNLVAANYQEEITGILTRSRPRMAFYLHKAILHQIFEPGSNLINICRDKSTDALLAWSWLERGKYTCFAPEEMACGEFLHMALEQSVRTRLTLTAQCLHLWETWTREHGIPVITSTSIRAEQRGFMRLHEQLGYSVRGSIAYKRIIV